MTDTFKLTELFGGAITVSLPAGYTDVSNIREVPDHQEIYLDASGFSSIVIEIAERVTDPPTDDEALRFHFEDIVDEQDSSRVWRTDIASLPHLPPNTPILTLLATTTPPPTTNGNTRALTPTFVAILLTLIRLEPQSTDLIVTVNIPHIPGHQEPTDGAVNFEEGKLGSLVQEGVKIRDEVWRTLEVKDWGLFEGGKEDEV
ncbi:MAG: hypothetical protein LQ350_000957 [Teloschistes chrysophthalmus]|nr:MAG: hypothetical protein LQ350_000957 [Niorma chrysophthalma]